MLTGAQTKFSIAEYFILAFFLLLETSVLVNLLVAAYLPIMPLVAILLILLISSLFDKRVLLIILVFSIHSSETLYLEVGSAIVRLIDIVILYVSGLLIFRWLLRSEKTSEFLPIFEFSLGLLVVGALVSLVGTISLNNSILELIQIIELIIAAYLFYNLIKNEKDINLVLAATLIYSIIDSIWILYQYASGQLLGRHIGLFGTLASELGYGFALSASYFYLVRQKTLKVAILLSGTLQMAAIYLTRGRGLLVTAILMAMLCNLLLAIHRRKLLPFILVSGAILLSAVISYWGLPLEVQKRVTSIIEGGQLRDLRLVIWAVTLKAWRQYPIFGVGFGNAEVALEAFAPKPFGITLTALTDVKGPHNEYLGFAIQGGIIGFLIGIIFYFILFQKAILCYLRSKRLTEYAIIMLSLVTGLIVYNFANDTLLAGFGMVVMLFMAIISRIYYENKSSSRAIA